MFRRNLLLLSSRFGSKSILLVSGKDLRRGIVGTNALREPGEVGINNISLEILIFQEKRRREVRRIRIWKLFCPIGLFSISERKQML
jgi:hypothetical protein